MRDNKGFTLVELLIVMALGSIVMAAVLSSFLSQHKSYLIQDDVVEMQQNIRVVMEMITNDIRSAGYKPGGTAETGIVTATAGRLGFTQDLTGNGDTNDAQEAITYGFSALNDSDLPPDGIADTGSAPLGRNTGTANGVGGSGFQPLGDNFQAIEFLYVLEDGTQVLSPTAAQLDSIRSIVVSVLALTSDADQDFVNTATYTSASGNTWGSPFNDNFRRRLLIRTVQCRNIGL